MKKFVNRAKKLDTLEKQYHSDESSLVIVYGRRRVGKTALITEFLKRHSDSLYFLAAEESEMQNLNYFKTQVAEFTGNELLKTATVDWVTIFKTLVEYKAETKKNNRTRRIQIYRAVQFGVSVRYAKNMGCAAQRRGCYANFVRLSCSAHEVADARLQFSSLRQTHGTNQTQTNTVQPLSRIF